MHDSSSSSPLWNNMNGMSALHYGAKHGHVDVVDLLLDTGAAGDVYTEDHAGWTPLHHAAANGKKKVVELLLEKSNGAGAWQVNAKTKNGSTPLALAISSSKLDVAYILLDHGAALIHEKDDDESWCSCKNNKGKTPLDMAPTPEIKADLLEYSRRNKEKLVMHQIDKLLCSVKTGHIALITTLNHNKNNTTTDMMMMQQQRAGKRPRPRW
jgi:ankyrin repeat protein